MNTTKALHPALSHPDSSHHFRPHVTKLINEEISQLAPFSGLILTLSLVIFFLVRYYIFETFLLRRCYGNKYLQLPDVQRRGFINHHIAATAKIVMLVSAAYPFFSVLFGTASVHHAFAGSRVVTLGDGMFVLHGSLAAFFPRTGWLTTIQCCWC